MGVPSQQQLTRSSSRAVTAVALHRYFMFEGVVPVKLTRAVDVHGCGVVSL
jgi:hypothetical protein